MSVNEAFGVIARAIWAGMENSFERSPTHSPILENSGASGAGRIHSHSGRVFQPNFRAELDNFRQITKEVMSVNYSGARGIDGAPRLWASPLGQARSGSASRSGPCDGRRGAVRLGALAGACAASGPICGRSNGSSIKFGKPLRH